MDRIEEVANIQLQVMAATLAAMHLADEGLQALDGGEGAFAFSVAVAVGDEAWLIDGFELGNDPVMHDAIGKGRRVNLAGFGAGRDEAR